MGKILGGGKILPCAFLVSRRREERKDLKRNYGKNKRGLLNTNGIAMLAAQHPPRASFRPPKRPLQASPAHGGERSKDHHCTHHKAPAMMIRIDCANTQSSPPFRRGREGRKIKLTCDCYYSNL